MEKYIQKSALIAEIEKLISNAQVKLQESQENNDQVSYIAWAEHIATCIKILSFIDTLEVKEVDFEKELENLIEKEKAFVTDDREVKYYNGDSFNHIYELEFIAKHFFELGLKAKGE